MGDGFFLDMATPLVHLCAFAFSAPTAATAKVALRGLFGGASDAVLACPATKSPLRRCVSQLGGERRQQLLSEDSSRRYTLNEVYADLVARPQIGISQLSDELFSIFSMQTGLFRTPAMAFLYERGWRQNFQAMGFPGIDLEFAEAAEFFALPADGGVVVDISCGTGLMARRLVRSGRYSRVYALDYSEEMLRETCRRFDEEDLGRDRLTLVRADAAELPLQTRSVDAIHAGAALHCWPRLEMSLAEVHRSLKPGGRFYATTFFEGALRGTPSQMRRQGSGSMRMFRDEAELEQLLVQAGFDESRLDVRREGAACAVIRATA